ncbi:MAG: SdiA-regulated domain-containing protein [Bacteroidota bacterium]
MKIATLLLAVTLAFSPSTPQPEGVTMFDLPYDFARPSHTVALDNELFEVSGLTVIDLNTLAAVQDEKGRIYFLDAQTGAIRNEIKFSDRGDYEGIERVGDKLWVLESDGDLYEVKDWDTDDVDTDRHENALKSKHDTEGLAYDPINDRLLIACKEFSVKGEKDKKAIYAFDLRTEELMEPPLFLIDRAEVQAAIDASTTRERINDRIRSFLSSAVDLSGFKPSALARHPLTGDWYLLSSVRKMLVVIDPAGAVQTVRSLSSNVFAQPEGIAFMPDGTLFISNEGRDGPPTLLRFDVQS